MRLALGCVLLDLLIPHSLAFKEERAESPFFVIVYSYLLNRKRRLNIHIPLENELGSSVYRIHHPVWRKFSDLLQISIQAVNC